MSTSSATTATDYFRTDDLQHSLGKRTARGGMYTFAATGLNFAVTAISTIWLTRQLSADDFGLYGMVLAITNFAAMFVDLGLSRAVVQKPHITHEQVSTLFWINLGIATILALVVAAATPLVCTFYGEPRLAPINLSMSLLFIFSGLALQHRALLQRRMEFAKINKVAALAPVIGAIAAVTIAIIGGGYWALVTGPAVTQLVNCLGMWKVCSWRPGWPRRGTGVRQMLAFGGHVTAFQFINYFSRNADNVLLGYTWGPIALGLYTRSYSLMILPASKIMTPLQQVILPGLSRLVDTPVRYRQFFRNALGLFAVLTAIPSVVFILISPELIPLLLGSKWNDIVPIFLALGPAVIVTCTITASSWLYLSFGHVDRQTFAGTVNMAVMILAILMGLPYGPLGIAIAVSTARVCCNIPYVAYSCQGTPISIKDYLQSVSWPIWSSVMAAIGSIICIVIYLVLCLPAGQPLPPLWQVLPLTTQELAIVLAIKLLSWVVFFSTIVFLIPSAKESIYLEPKRLFLKLRGASNPS